MTRNWGKHVTDTGNSEEKSMSWQPPSEDEIRQRAYELFLDREHECGGPLDDWLEAEAELFLSRKRNANDHPRDQ